MAARLVVDGNNVMGSRPDGWWRDRAGAARRLVAAIEAWAGEREVLVVFDGASPAGAGGAPARDGMGAAAPGGEGTTPHERERALADEQRPAAPHEQQPAPPHEQQPAPPHEQQPTPPHDGAPRVEVRHSGPRSADDVIAEHVRAAEDPSAITVVTSDAGLAGRVRACGASVTGAGAFRRELGA